MGALMPAQVRGAAKGLPALGTPERPLPGVCAVMPDELRAAAEGLAAAPAHVLFPAHVDSLMSSEV